MIKYCCPLPVTFVVLLILIEPSGLLITVSLISNRPSSIDFCVGIFLLDPVLIKYPLSLIHVNNLRCPVSTPFCFRIFASSQLIWMCGLQLLHQQRFLWVSSSEHLQVMLYYLTLIFNFLVSNFQRPCKNLFRRIPCFLQVNEVLTVLSAFFRPLDHADLLCHIYGNLIIL